jgi:phosphoribosylanthranilate isomerase
MFLKICGITRLDDAKQAIDEGATALGFVLWPRSPRFVSDRHVADIVAAVPASVKTVGVFVNESLDAIFLTMARTGLSMVQLHGDEPGMYGRLLAWPVLKSVTLDTGDDVMDDWPAETTFLVDAADRERRGGTGEAVDWTRAAALARKRRLVLAGGLTAANVGDAIAAVRPYGVDVSSGVEDAPGLKNARKVSLFLSRARQAETLLRANQVL